ncbi:hypothetical protein BTO04_10415 [Polaribacter sp. SA4-10]|uniref:hypothetical protein n=1 Tax=Polaribacter sp. SA4-10 TaxID=754397 RepID=UPI000B3CC10C|nr:hypothetical protein [Polaribacter sp. SA4-10]ARV07076.1 hypothetical protein BTO04_10415 [Polaribacter sp. SA4-10]
MNTKLNTLFAALLITASTFGQTPDKLNYQGVIRNSSNALVTNTAVGMQISIIKAGVPDTTVYVETQAPTTNGNGLVSFKIGEGTLVSGNITTIDWSEGTYAIKTETDLTNDGIYTITGTSDLSSVPYALQAKTASNLSSSSAAALNPAECNCSSYIIPYMPYSSNSSQIMYISNNPASWFGGAVLPDSDITAEAVDSVGNYYDLGIIGTAPAGAVTKITSLVLKALESQGFMEGKVSIRITLSHPEYAFVYASYNAGGVRGYVDVKCVRF